MTMQGPLTQWVTDHRKHHALSDVEGDPHSPHAGYGPGIWSSIKGFVHAHVGWLFRLKGMERGEHYGKDLYDDPLIRRIDRLYLLWVVLTFGIPFLIGYLAGGFSLGAGAAGARMGGSDPDLRVSARDLRGELDLPPLGAARLPAPATRAATTGSSPP